MSKVQNVSFLGGLCSLLQERGALEQSKASLSSKENMSMVGWALMMISSPESSFFLLDIKAEISMRGNG